MAPVWIVEVKAGELRDLLFEGEHPLDGCLAAFIAHPPGAERDQQQSEDQHAGEEEVGHEPQIGVLNPGNDLKAKKTQQ